MLSEVTKELEALIASVLEMDIDLRSKTSKEELLAEKVAEFLSMQPSELGQRLKDEIEGLGPLGEILADEAITEILINSPEQIWFERSGQIQLLPDIFQSHRSYQRFLHRICDEARIHLTLERPYASGKWGNFRLQIVGKELAVNETIVSLRKHPKNRWTLAALQQASWCSAEELDCLKGLLERKANILIIGSTGSGKTSVLNALLQELPSSERCIVIEDTCEIELSKGSSIRLLTRSDPATLLPTIDQAELIRQSLRLRPDRIVMGEIRGGEAKDLILALSTGHQGSISTLHASSPQQALTRLEMLVQLGASMWNLQAIRKMIQLGLQYVVQVERCKDGRRRLCSIYRLVSLEETGFLLEPVR